MLEEKFPVFNFEKSVTDLEKVKFSYLLKNKNPIILDTNFLFTTFEFKVDIISELRRVIGGTFSLYIYEGTIGELKSVERKGDKNKRFLPLISKMLHLYDFKVIKSNKKYIDEQILSNLNSEIFVATNDKELRKKIWEVPSRVIYLRQKKYFEVK